jgi:Dolichyl-phosphate-mannose-protein mannosyltransferase
MLTELESIAPGPGGLASSAWAIARRHAVAAGLVAVAGVSIALRVVLARQLPAPFFFMDELGYEQMAKSLAATGHLAIFGKHGTVYAPLYPLLLSPIYALTSSAPQAYEWAKALNAVLMSLAVFPVYGIARYVLSRPRALGVAALSAVAPLMFYADLELSENLAYPLTLLALWAMLRAVREPRLQNDALLLGAILLATAARFQQLALFPAALTAIVLVALVRPGEQSRWRAVVRAIGRHRLLFGTVAVGFVAVLARTIANGGWLPLAGRYANVGHASFSPFTALVRAVQHLAAFDFALGVVPFAAALVAAYALARAGFPRDGLVFGAVAVGATAWLLVVVGVDAAVFDREYVPHVGEQLPPEVARIHERYLIYLVPLFLTALVAALRVARPRVSARVHVAAVAAAALLPAAIPFRTMINDTSIAESFGLQVFGKNVAGTLLPYGHAALVALAIGGFLALTYCYAFLRPRPSFAVVTTVCVFVIFSSVVRVRLVGASRTIADSRAHARWVDRAVDGGEVELVAGPGAQRAAIVETAFENFSVARIYYVCAPAFESDFGERQLAADGTDSIRARYAVVPTAFHPQGRVLGRYPKGGLVLVAPAGGVLKIPSVSCS